MNVKSDRLLATLFFSAVTIAKEQLPLTPSNVLAAATDDDWRTVDQSNLLYLQLESGQVIFELAPDFAPNHIANLRVLAQQHYFDDLAIIRSQDNYVVQWGDPNAEGDEAKSRGKAKQELEPEFFRDREGLEFVAIDSQDPYADSVGFAAGFAVGADDGRAWLTHCYGTLGVGRGMLENSGNAAELYVVTGHAPRHLDRNVTLIGRTLSGIEHLSSLPRGTGTLGFYESPAEYVKIKSIRFGDQLEPDQRKQIQVFRTDTDTFNSYVRSRTTRLDEWFLDPTGKIEVCNVGVPVREAANN